jgi:hypothetical protein
MGEEEGLGKINSRLLFDTFKSLDWYILYGVCYRDFTGF